MTKAKNTKSYWRVMRRDEHNKIRDGCRIVANSRKDAKEQAARQWGLDTIKNLTALRDRDL